jgi:hypothetical protein
MPKNPAVLWWSVGGIIIVALGLVALGHYSEAPAPSTAVVDSSALPGLQQGNAPWVSEISHLHERLKAIGLPALAQEGTALHIHQHLEIFIDGKAMNVPAEIGIGSAGSFIAPIHVHDASGIMHVESPVVQSFYLGQFFDIWGVRLSSTCIGGYCASADTANSTSTAQGAGKSLRVYVNGTLYQGDPRQLELKPHQEIVITYGTASSTPNPIPSTFTFPAGY